MKSIAVLILGLLTGCSGSSSEPQPQPVVQAPPEEVAQPQSEAAKPLPPFEIVSTDTMQTYKRSVEVRLEGPVSEDDLKRLAHAIRDADSTTYERTFILHYLPDMPTGQGAWATTHFNPGLQVVILGMTAVEEAALKEASAEKIRDEVGRWQDNHSGSLITVYREGGKTLLELAFKDGSALNKEMIPSETGAGTRLDEVGGNDFGEYYLIDKKGNLQSFDEMGLISTAKPAR